MIQPKGRVDGDLIIINDGEREKHLVTWQVKDLLDQGYCSCFVGPKESEPFLNLHTKPIYVFCCMSNR